MNSIILNKNKEYYLNGNYMVFYDYGDRQIKRCLRIGEDFKAEFPDSIDLKITNKCSHGCLYCHENSVSEGASFNLDHTIETLRQLPKYPIEIAIGGGNVLDIPNETIKLINWCNDYGFKTRITVNHKDIKKFCHKIRKNRKDKIEISAEEEMILEIGTKVGGVGISLDPNLLPETDELMGINTILVEKLFGENELNDNTISSCLRGKNIVFHIIAGLFPIDKLRMILSKDYTKSLGNLLILGYKQFGRAANTELPESLPKFEKVIKEFITSSRNDYCISVFNIAFDNLALEQLHMKEFITEDDWDHLYLGKEGSCSMYIDAVNETYARSSTSIERVSWKDVSLLDYFKSLKDEDNN